MKNSVIVFTFAALAACSTAPVVTEPEPEKVMLSDEAFQILWDTAYKSDPESDSEIAFTELLARDDLTGRQRGEAYYGRGTMRGIYVRDWNMAYPQCALGDFMQAKDYPISEARMTQMKKSMAYQLDRRKHFPKAPRPCMEYAAEALVWLYAGEGKEE